MNKESLRYLICGAAVTILVGYLVYTGISKTGAYFMTVEEVIAQRDLLIGRDIRINGFVQRGSIDWNFEDVQLRFAITKEGNGSPSSAEAKDVIKVVYNGIKPDNFSDNYPVIVEGKLVSSDRLDI